MLRVLVTLPLLLITASALAQSEAPGPASQPAAAPAPASQPARAPEPAADAAKSSACPVAEMARKDAAAQEAPGSAVAPLAGDAEGPERSTWALDLDTRVQLLRRGPFTLNMGGLIQVQGAFYVGDEAAIQFHDPADSEGFRIRRARFGFSGQLLADIGYYLAVDLKDAVTAAMGGSVGNEVLDAMITWNRYSVIQIAAGVDRVPFSTFALLSSSELALIERPLMVTLLAPDRRVGLRVSGQLGALDYAAGLFNGSEGVTSGNRLAGIAAGVRADYHVLGRHVGFVPRDLGLAIGAGYVYENGLAVNSHRAAVGLQAEGYRARLTGELLWFRSSPDEVPAGEPDAGVVTRWGAAGELSLFVWREHVELAGRYERFHDNERLVEFGRQQLISAGMNIYFCRHRFKLQANYVRRWELTGPDVQNDIAFAQLQAKF